MTTETSHIPAPRFVDSGVLRRALVFVGVGFAVLIAILVVGGGRPQAALPGVPDPGALTGWGLPVLRLASDLNAILSIGFLLAAGVLLPSRAGWLTPIALRCRGGVTLCAGLWAACAFLALALTFSNVYGQPLSVAMRDQSLMTFALESRDGRALLGQAGLAVLVSLAAPWTVRARGARLLLLVAVLGLGTVAATGHSSAVAEHDLIAMSSLFVHVTAASLWVGGLAALVVIAHGDRMSLPIAVPRFSMLALGCVGAIVASGSLSAWLILGSVEPVLTSRYGLLLLLKAEALLLLMCLGWLHRTRTVPALEEGPSRRSRRAFAQIAGFEVLVMVMTIALAVGLSRTPTPMA